MFLFPHWTAGGFSGSVATLQNPSRESSAHYVIEEDNVAQLVNEGNTAWHCGNSWYNWRSIAYEMVGWDGHPPTKGTLDTTAGLMAQASRDYFGGAPLVLGQNVMLHKMVASTRCPGESDINYLIAKANEYLGNGTAPVGPGGGGGSSSGSIPDLRYRVHAGGVWLPEMINHRDTGGSSDTYAGNGNPITAIAIDMPGWYQVRTKNYGWMDRVSGYDINDYHNGYAGDLADPITAVRCWYETPDPASTGYFQIRYAVANVGEGFLPDMVDLTDTGGGSDDFAGNGGIISAFQARLQR